MEVIKLGTLLLKTLSKPLAKGLKARITTHPTLSKRTEEVGQLTHQVHTRAAATSSAGLLSLAFAPFLSLTPAADSRCGQKLQSGRRGTNLSA